jgi:hypothetical protein
VTDTVLADSLPAGFLPIPLIVRIPVAAALIWWGATGNRRWTVPVGATLALPALWIGGLATLAALATVGRPELEATASRPSESVSSRSLALSTLGRELGRRVAKS